jgi:hypothetical protein
MSFLAPLYVLGALGIGLPVLFHLIRRQPRDQRRFSSLMFLKPTPPTLTKRSRLDNWPLLLIRALALLLLAAAFARPYLRSPILEQQAEPGKRLVVLVDTSASMLRTGLWQQANQEFATIIKKLKPSDHVAVVSFNSSPRIEMSFDQSATLDFEARLQAANQAIKGLKPSWNAGELGAALVTAAELLTTTTETAESNATESSPEIDAAGHVVVISDFQIGGDDNLKGLQSYSWPKEIHVEVCVISPDLRTNAFATILRTSDDELDDDSTSSASANVAAPQETRVRISNSADATKADFNIHWADASKKQIESTRLPTHVSPGESRVVRIPLPPATAEQSSLMQLVLDGDDHEFDNIRYVARPAPLKQQLLFVGPSNNEPRGSLRYYLERAPLDNRSRTVELVTAATDSLPAVIDARQTPLMIVADTFPEDRLQTLRQYITSGGNVLWVLDANTDLTTAQTALRRIGDAPDLVISPAVINDYAMWSRIDFEHPLFRPLADVRYNDFTKIRFWSHRTVAGAPEEFRRIAVFDDGDAAILERGIGAGRLWIMTAGWQPTDSQLALSTKFVPLLYGMFGYSSQNQAPLDNLTLGQPLPFSPSPTALIKDVQEGAFAYKNVSDFEALEAPGFYRFIEGSVEVPFALNVALSESRTEMMEKEELERLGLSLGTLDQSQAVTARQRQQRDVELEGSQRIWQWLLIAVLGLLGAESLLSGLIDRRNLTASNTAS